ncbi:MAG: hypothetical protein KH828_05985, partial [Clostridiales bacterium]|nr:hypothetical protein [Clostridiales bacterium]
SVFPSTVLLGTFFSVFLFDWTYKLKLFVYVQNTVLSIPFTVRKSTDWTYLSNFPFIRPHFCEKSGRKTKNFPPNVQNGIFEG